MKDRFRRIAIRTAWVLTVLMVSLGTATAVVAYTSETTPNAVLSYAHYKISRIGKSPSPPPPAAATRDGRWRQDLAYLAAELPRLHVNAFHTTSRGVFEAHVSRLDARIPELADHEIMVELMRIVSLVGDGHTSTWTWAGRFHRYPVVLRWLDGALYVTASDEAHTRLLGARVIRIGEATPADALERVRPLISSDSAGDFLSRAEGVLAYAEILHALELQDSVEFGDFMLEDRSGRIVQVRLPTIETGTEAVWRTAGPVPLYRERPGEDFWMRYLAEHNLVYLKYNRCRDPAGFRALSEELFSVLDSHALSTLVVDLRGNGGGNERVIAPLLRGIEARRLGEQERLWVLTDAGTFSSATGNAGSLRKLGALTAGGPTGDGIDGYGEVEQFRLPNSGVEIVYSTRYWRRTGSEAPLLPDLLIRPSIDDVLTGYDPVLTTIVRGQRAVRAARVE